MTLNILPCKHPRKGRLMSTRIHSNFIGKTKIVQNDGSSVMRLTDDQQLTMLKGIHSRCLKRSRCGNLKLLELEKKDQQDNSLTSTQLTNELEQLCEDEQQIFEIHELAVMLMPPKIANSTYEPSTEKYTRRCTCPF
mmetsp:Transcript_26108/g.39507  ORF Transcript_26108/g.39507 Transcript_26108/m.39507 type:complete len:137 (-) Transcript_26108:227-637(-)